MFKKNNNAFLELECQEPAKRKLAELIEMPIKGIKKVLIRTSGSNGLTNFLKTFMVQITIKNKLGDRVMYFSRDKMDTYNHYPPEFLNQMFYMCCPKVIIIDDFQGIFQTVFTCKIVHHWSNISIFVYQFIFICPSHYHLIIK